MVNVTFPGSTDRFPLYREIDGSGVQPVFLNLDLDSHEAGFGWRRPPVMAAEEPSGQVLSWEVPATILANHLPILTARLSPLLEVIVANADHGAESGCYVLDHLCKEAIRQIDVVIADFAAEDGRIAAVCDADEVVREHAYQDITAEMGDEDLADLAEVYQQDLEEDGTLIRNSLKDAMVAYRRTLREKKH